MVKKSLHFWLIKRLKWVEILNFLNFLSTGNVYEIISVPDPKLKISDPQIENQEFRIRILLSTRDGEKKVFNFG